MTAYRVIPGGVQATGAASRAIAAMGMMRMSEKTRWALTETGNCWHLWFETDDGYKSACGLVRTEYGLYEGAIEPFCPTHCRNCQRAMER